jgi:hypothetical protein
MKAPSQTWRTFLANHFGDLAFASTAMSSYAPANHDIVDACVCRFAPLRLHATGGRASGLLASVDWPHSLQRQSFGRRVGKDHRHDRTRTHLSSGKDPPESCAVEFGANACGERPSSGGPVSPNGLSRLRRFDPAQQIPISSCCGVPLSAIRSSTSRRRDHLSFRL